MTDLNTEVLESTMQFIIDHPEKHRQSTWAEETECGTVACFAGWSAMLHAEQYGFRPISSQLGLTMYAPKNYETAKAIWNRFCDTKEYDYTKNPDVVPFNETVWHCADVTTFITGLTNDEARKFFYGAKTAEDLQLMVKNLANGEDAYGTMSREDYLTTLED